MVREKLSKLDDNALYSLMSMDLKAPTTLTIVSVFAGALGVDRFMIGDIGMGILKLLTGGVCGILTIYDWITIGQKAKQQNLNKLLSLS